MVAGSPHEEGEEQYEEVGEFEDDEEEYVEGEEYEDDEEEEEEEEEDGEVEEVEDEDEEEEVEEINPQQAGRGGGGAPGGSYIRGLEPLPARGGPAAPARRPAEASKEWSGLQQMPKPTREAVQQLIEQLRGRGKTALTVLLLGKGGVGKSSTVNSLLGERVANVAALQSDVARPQVIARSADGFTLKLIDTPGLLEADAVSDAMLSAIVYTLRDKTVDAVLFMDRLDSYRVDASDVQVIEGMTRVLGRAIWNSTVIGLTHGRLTSLPGNMPYGEYVERRHEALRDAIRWHGDAKGAPLALALVENATRAPADAAGEKLLGNDRPWRPDAFRQLAAAAERGGFRYDAKAVKRADPNKRRRWLIPVILAAQVAFKLLVLDRVLEEDSVTGDAYGPYDADLVERERKRLRVEKERARKRRETEQERKRTAKHSTHAPVRRVILSDSEDEDEEEEEEEEEQ